MGSSEQEPMTVKQILNGLVKSIDRVPPAALPEQPRPDVCPVCNGSGWLYAAGAGGRPMFNEVLPCVCRAAELRQWHVRMSRLDPADTTRFSTFEPRPGTKTALAAAMAMASGKTKHHFLTLFGLPGTGKTHLARSIGWAWIEQARGSVLYYKVAGMLDALRSTYDQPKGLAGQVPAFDRAMARILSADLLILDDLGVQKPTEWAMDKLDSIIDHRYEGCMFTVVTTNLTAEEIGPRISSRLREGVLATITASDYRLIKGKKRDGQHD